jgi:hypothetical protein
VKASELAAEQVLIGGLVLAVVLLPWWPESSATGSSWSPIVSLAGGVVLLAACYLLGIVFDRLADTLTEDLERHHRLRFALAWPALRDRQPPAVAQDWQDPFPEDHFRLAVLRDSDAVVEWLDYHRSRIRLARSLALFLPVLTISGVLTSARLAGPPPGALGHPASLVIVPLVFSLAVWQIWRRRLGRAAGSEGPTWLVAPRTDQPEAYRYGQDCGYGGNDEASRRLRRSSLIRALASDPAVQASTVMIAFALIQAAAIARASVIVVAMVGAVVSALSGWAWWRISAAYRHYLRHVTTTQPKR